MKKRERVEIIVIQVNKGDITPGEIIEEYYLKSLCHKHASIDKIVKFLEKNITYQTGSKIYRKPDFPYPLNKLNQYITIF